MDDAAQARSLDRRFELFEALILALAAVMTAWAAFQSTKWSGVQADDYSRASASRVEATRAATRAGQLSVVDVIAFTAWIDAVSEERRAGIDSGLAADGTYRPAPGTESTFFHERFRDEFRPAFDEWMADRPLADPDAPPTPFAMDGYQLAEEAEAADLERQSHEYATAARAANQYGDNYVLMAILFAVVLFFTGVGSKMDTFRARTFLFVAAVVVLVGATVVTFTFPIEL